MWFRRRPFGAWRRPLFWRPVRPWGRGFGWGCGGALAMSVLIAVGLIAMRMIAHALLR